jgi:hypothetical protein
MEKSPRLTAELVTEMVDGIPYATVLEGARDQIAVAVGDGDRQRVVIFGVSEAEQPDNPPDEAK